MDCPYFCIRVLTRSVKANSHIQCRSHALPYRAAKGLDCVFPIWFTQCGRVWFIHAMPRPCHATTMPFWKRLLKATAQRGMGMAWHVWISIGRPETTCGRPACVRLLPLNHVEFHEGCYQQYANALNCRTSSSDISGYHADFHEGHGTVGERQGRGKACVN
jgi:hypothetical protein